MRSCIRYAAIFSVLSGLSLPFFLPSAAGQTATAQDTDVKDAERLVTDSLGTTPNVHRFGNIFLAGQPSPEDIELAAKRGIEIVISLRETGEEGFDEPAVVLQHGMKFYRFGFRAPDSLTDSLLEDVLKVLRQAKQKRVLLHCSSANRVGAIWLAHRVLNDGLPLEDARREAKEVGLRTPAFELLVREFIDRKQKEEKSARPGINDRFLAPDLNVTEWLGRFEIESREVYAHRMRVLDACQLEPGQRVADVGAGTGFYSRLFADAVGDDGWVFAVDIAPKFLEHINRRASADGISNITCVLCSEKSITLPPESVDAVFICDTYHHFEYPQSTLASIYRALKPGGQVLLIDFERIPGKSREFIINHVRAGKQVFRTEIETAGFEFVEEIRVPGFAENYFLRFKRPADPE